MEKPQTRFTRAGTVAIAYQTIGEGPVDLVYSSGWMHNIDVIWEHQGYRRLLNALAEKCRLILFDKRGTGMSDRSVGAPTMEERADDIRAVMDAVGSERASLFGVSEGGNMSTMFAASYPERVRSLVLFSCFPCRAWKPDWPLGERRGDFEKLLTDIEVRWGDLGHLLEWLVPSVGKVAAERDFLNRLFTQSASPSSAIALTRLNYEIDIRPILPSVQAPTLVLHASEDQTVPLEFSQYLADHIPNGSLKTLEGADHFPWIGKPEITANVITDFVQKGREEVGEDRFLTTIMITDIVGSTEKAASIGDAAWRELITSHDNAAARAIARYDGTLVKSLGDGILAYFSGPSRAVASALSLKREAKTLGLSLRVGLHTGECLKRSDDLAGLAVVAASRIADQAAADEVWVSSVVSELSVGSEQEYEKVGDYSLKGLTGEWALYRVRES